MLALAVLVGVLLLFLQKVDVLRLEIFDGDIITSVVGSSDVEFEYLSNLLFWL